VGGSAFTWRPPTPVPEVYMQKFYQGVGWVSEWTGKLASFLMAGLVVAICYDVFMRYVFAKPTYWAFEVTYMVYGAYSMLGVAYCEKFGAHVRMDLLYSRLSEQGKARMDIICYLLLFFPFLIILTYKCGEHTLWTMTSGESSSVSVWRPRLWPFKLAITLGFVLFILQGLATFLQLFRKAFGGNVHES
jgi:TRAP-type mannitol/chloroaromatic compound transport system permease small subunit